jgi:exodeoxyribonuclease VII large subunit
VTQPGEVTRSARERPLTVGQLVRLAGVALEREVGLVWVEGECTQVSRPPSGHIYFTLRDRAAVIPAVIWRKEAARMRFRLDAGMSIRVRGRLGIYERDGKFQLYVDFAEPAGLGAEALALQQLKEQLTAEGLFADAKKRPLPHLPRRIGVVTSATGAAVRDIIRAVHRRFPVPILICDCSVQGPDAPRQIVYALRTIVRADVDVVIVGRGGGSAQDLAAFNDERVVRAVAASPVPVISAVGHEVDLTLCDLAADRRASTPTMAAEMAVPVLADLEASLLKEERRLSREIELVVRHARQDVDALDLAARAGLQRRVTRGRAELTALERRLANRHPRTRLHEQRAMLERGRQRLDAAIRRRDTASAADLGKLAARLDAMSPLRVLERGYAVATRDGHVITDAAQVAPGDEISVRVSQGTFRARVTETD